ncbi:MAG: aldehyde ferredoxin oxidoreductase C-terminal domain-containing protein [Desulfoplanes sp.]|nr:aldehyde ferredoxin oxidoreductase C-terminal domain-containing protein [Desulfoplanes sp.]
MTKILRINTRERSFRYEELGEYAGLGGRALTSRMVLNEVPATCNPIGPDNKIVMATGLLAGTLAANSGRISLGAKSPLTGGIKESNSGGMMALKMAKLDLLAVVLEDKPAKDTPLCTIKITKDGVTFEDASSFEGMGTYPVAEQLLETHGKKTAVMVIGPAGETLRLASSIQFTDPKGHPARAAGRGGLGAVMGSKRVKALVIDDAGGAGSEYADKDAFKVASKRWVEILRNHPVTGQGLPAFGTCILINILNEAGALPTKNFRQGRFDEVAEISGEKMVEHMEARGGRVKEGCHPGCVIQCSQSYNDKDGKYITSGMEYETVWAFGSNSLVHDIDDIARMDRLCDDIGVDTIDIANAVVMAMDGGMIPWGDSKAAIELLNRMYDKKDPLGQIIGNGTAFAGEAFGIDRIPVVKRQAIPAYDPRSVKGVGVTYATTPMGADHTAGYAVCQNILKVGGDVDPLKSSDENIEISKNLQIATAAVDATGLCLFVAFAVLDTEDSLDVIAKMISAKYGIDFKASDVAPVGVNILRDEYAFNEAAGFTKADDQLPEFFSKEIFPPHNTRWEYSIDDLQKAKA